MCSGGMSGRQLSVEEKLAQIDGEIELTQHAIEDAKGLPARLAWLREQRELLVRGPISASDVSPEVTQ